MERLLRARGGMSKKQCQVLFADEGEVAAMTGFVHNSVTPVGMDCEMPIFLSHHVVRTHATTTPLHRDTKNPNLTVTNRGKRKTMLAIADLDAHPLDAG